MSRIKYKNVVSLKTSLFWIALRAEKELIKTFHTVIFPVDQFKSVFESTGRNEGRGRGWGRGGGAPSFSPPPPKGKNTQASKIEYKILSPIGLKQ